MSLEQDRALARLLAVLRRRSYRFVTITPSSHARVLARPGREHARCVEDVLGWSLPFAPGSIDTEVESLLGEAGMLEPVGDMLRATVRVSSLGSRLFLHSSYPTDASDSVFFGPDSYRFADLIARELAAAPVGPGGAIVDIGAGSGVGAIVAAGLSPGARLWLTDVNPLALRFARINAADAGFACETLLSPSLDGAPEQVALAVANPPYIADEQGRAYRDGGALRGARTSLDMAAMAAARLAPGGRLILYTGSAIVGGRDLVREQLEQLAENAGCSIRYAEIDPDVFGEELDREVYSQADRIAVVGAVLARPVSAASLGAAPG